MDTVEPGHFLDTFEQQQEEIAGLRAENAALRRYCTYGALVAILWWWGSLFAAVWEEMESW